MSASQITHTITFFETSNRSSLSLPPQVETKSKTGKATCS